MGKTIELHKRWKDDPSKGEVFTPELLVEEMLDKIPTSVWENPTSIFLDPCMGKGTFLIDILHRLTNIYGYSLEDAMSRIYGYDVRVKYINYLKRGGFKNVFHKDFLNENIDMKFDVILGNPPYQKKVGPKKTESLWDKFFHTSINLLKPNGYLSLIHPGGWRNVDGKYKYVQEEIKSKNLKFLSINSVDDGQKLFNATTPFDWYVIQNKEYEGVTTIKFQDGTVGQTNISKLEFIPNDNFDTVISLISHGDEETVEVIHSYSNYETRKDWVSKVQNEDFPYPVVYSVLSDGTVNFMYSSTNQKGHFGIPKLILGNGANPTCFIDYNGEYGMTQFTYGIVDTIENLERLKEVITSDEFQKVNLATKYVATAGNPLIYPKIAKTFRKDFWKEFINE